MSVKTRRDRSGIKQHISFLITKLLTAIAHVSLMQYTQSGYLF